MTPEEMQQLDRRMAELMGWELEMSCWDGEYWWFTSPDSKEAGTPIGGRPVMKVNDWHPTRNVAQAELVVKKMGELGWRIYISCPSIIDSFLFAEAQFARILEDYVRTERVASQSLSLATCLAADAAWQASKED